jgi:steroid delta-isomerase-like uncharacterized protein
VLTDSHTPDTAVSNISGTMGPMTTSNPNVTEHTLTPEELLNLASVTDVLRCWNAGDISGVLEYYRADILWRNVALEQEYRGHQEVGAFIGALLRWLPDLNFEVTQKIACGSNVAERWRMSGTHLGTFLGVPATGKRIEIHGMSMLITRNGRFVQDEFYFDAMNVLGQMGLIPPVTSLDSPIGRIVSRSLVNASKIVSPLTRLVDVRMSHTAPSDLHEQPPVDEVRLNDHERANLRAVEHLMQLRNAHSVPEMLRDCDDRIRWSDQATGAVYTGKAAIQDYLDRIFAAFPDGTFSPTHRIVHGDLVAQQWVLRGTHGGPLYGVPATGRQIAVPGISMIELRDNYPVSETLYYDHGVLFRQLGIMPPPTIGDTSIGRACLWLMVRRRPVAVVAAVMMILMATTHLRRRLNAGDQT